jgi:hypothetical protein
MAAIKVSDFLSNEDTTAYTVGLDIERYIKVCLHLQFLLRFSSSDRCERITSFPGSRLLGIFISSIRSHSSEDENRT